MLLYLPWIRPSNAPLCAEQAETFQITHPFHPWFEKTYQLVHYRHSWGEDRVYFHDETGALWSVPARWTNVIADDPFVVVAAGRSAFRITDLIQLNRMVQEIKSQYQSDDPKGKGSEDVK
jgi:hypothetical protein